MLVPNWGRDEWSDGMDGNLFDRITKTLAGGTRRREAVKALAGTGLAAVAARLGVDQADAQTRCRKRRQKCGDGKKCCDKSGLLKCRDFPAGECQNLNGRHCCGLEGARCDNTDPLFEHCDCCAPLFCGDFDTPGVFRCQTEDT
jgi:hypothetical protein